VFIAADLFSGGFEDLNALAIYNYLPRRLDVGMGLFHSKNYFSSTVTSLGEPLGRLRDFSERNYGAFVATSYPFHRFKRIELNFGVTFVERVYYERDEFGQYFAGGTDFESVTTPTISLIGDNALYGYYGPVNGQRYNLTFGPAFAWLPNGVSHRTVTFDSRRYVDLTHGYTFANRLLVGLSYGEAAQAFRVGGYSTLRGYPDLSIEGSRVVILNTEFRFPFIHQLGLVGPVPLGVFNLRGVGFVDAGLVWNENDPLRATRVIGGSPRLESPKLGFGAGIRSSFLFMVFKLDVAWASDLRIASEPRWHFSVGPEF
jgi:outer membrane protein assembly factor BamA